MIPESSMNLWLMRHAKSSWNNANLTDFERPLNERGRRDAPVMARRLLDIAGEIDLILTSTAQRALSTAEIVYGEFPKAEFKTMDSLYLASANQIIEHLMALGSSHRRVILVAHNPGLEELVQHWSGNTSIEMPTAAIAHFEFQEIPWPELRKQNQLTLQSVIKPKDDDRR